jgi:hypothetical protein
MFDGKCAYTGTPLDDKWQVDHIIPVSSYLWYQPKEHRLKHGINYERNDAENLMPCVGIINHYKRSLDLEEFRKYMSDFHLRIKRLPKNPYTPKSIKTKEYMLTVASLFGITPDKPFCGQFYFEKISVLNQPSPL